MEIDSCTEKSCAIKKMFALFKENVKYVNLIFQTASLSAENYVCFDKIML